MDDVLENLSVAWVDYLNKKYGTTVKPEEVVDWQVDQFFPELTKDQVYGALWDDALWQTVRPIEGASEILRELMNDGHEVYIVTNSHYRALVSKMDDVLFKYFPYLSWDQVIITSNKQMIRGDVLIDDGIHNLVDGDYIKILMDCPYNHTYDAEAMGMYRVNSWRTIRGLIRDLSNRPTYRGVRI